MPNHLQRLLVQTQALEAMVVDTPGGRIHVQFRLNEIDFPFQLETTVDLLPTIAKPLARLDDAFLNQVRDFVDPRMSMRKRCCMWDFGALTWVSPMSTPGSKTCRRQQPLVQRLSPSGS